MTITEDPLLALIVRFVVSEDRKEHTTDEEFVQRQLATLQAYVDRYPAEEKQPRAMQWIEQHAESYRREWQKKCCPTRLRRGAVTTARWAPVTLYTTARFT